MKKLFKYNSELIRSNLRAVMIFEVLYKITAATVLSPIIRLLLNQSIRWSGIGYLTYGNIKQYLKSPWAIACIGIIVIIMLVYTLFEISALIVCFDNSRKAEKISSVEIAVAAFKKLRILTKPTGVFIAIMTLLIIPVSGLPLFSGALTDLDLSKFLQLITMHYKSFSILFPFVMLLIALISILFIFQLHYIILEGKGVFSSFISALKLLKKRKVKSLVCIIIWYLAIAVALLIIYVCMIAVMALIVKIFNAPDYAVAVFLSVFRMFNIVIVFVFSCLAEPFGISIISAIFFRIKAEKKENLSSTGYYHFNEKKRFFIDRKILPALFIITFSVNIFYLSSSIKHGAFENIEFFRIVDITAHRGSSAYAPENTLSAIDLAIKQKADYAEIDVHCTFDGRVVLLHDSNLYRTTGVNQYIWNTTYEEVSKLDAGSWFSDEFAGEKIPTLEEAIDMADGRIKLNIEIKASEFEKDIISKVVEIIHEKDFVDGCIITSFNYSLLKEVKALDPNIQTGLISALIAGNYNSLPAADLMSMNYRYLNKDKISEMHKNGIRVLAWTVNDKTTMKKLIEYGVDNIITDNPVLAREVVYFRGDSRFITRLIEIVFEGYI